MIVFLRERYSYQFFVEQFIDINCLLTPDIVLELPYYNSSNERKNALVCFRKDLEKEISDEVYGDVLQYLSLKFEKVEDIDTHIYWNPSQEEAESEIYSLWNKIANTQILITDRLHGMIFAYLTLTPCVVLLSKSHKVKGVYEWIKEAEYIRLVDNVKDMIHIGNK